MRALIGKSVAAGNASDATVFTMPATFEGFISSILAYNSTGGSLDLTLKVKRAGADTTILAASAVGAGATTNYNSGSTIPLAPIVLNTGDSLLAQGSGSGITVDISGMRFSIQTS